MGSTTSGLFKAGVVKLLWTAASRSCDLLVYFKELWKKKRNNWMRICDRLKVIFKIWSNLALHRGKGITLPCCEGTIEAERNRTGGRQGLQKPYSWRSHTGCPWLVWSSSFFSWPALYWKFVLSLLLYLKIRRHSINI